MSRILFFIAAICFVQELTAQSWQWGARGGGGSNGSSGIIAETVVDMATDNSGNVYVLSGVNGGVPITITGNPNGIPTYGRKEILVTSYDCNGNYRWKKMISGAGDDNGTAIGVDTLGNVYVTGAVGPANPPTQPPHFDSDTAFTYANFKMFFLVKYDTSGNFKWLRQPTPDTMAFSRQFASTPRDMIVNPNGDIEILCHLSPGLLSGSNIVVDTPSAYILKYDKDGNITGLVKPDLNWRQVAGDGMAATSFRHLRMTKTPSGNYIIAGGQNLGTPNIDPMTLNGVKIRKGMFAASFDKNWNFKWKALNDTTFYWFNYRPSVDESGNIYLTGNACDESGFSFNGFTFSNSLYPNSFTSLPFMAKLDSNGNNIWVKNASAMFTCSAGSGILNNNQLPYISGNYTYMMWDTLTMYKASGSDVFLIRLDPGTGALIKADSLKGASGYSNFTTAIANDTRGNIYLGGEMGSNFTIGSSNLQSAGGNSDFFIAKYGDANCSGTPVPVRLLNFAAALQQQQVLTQWQTAQEQNTKAFIIERSSNAQRFDSIGIVAAKGNSNVRQSYSYIDLTPASTAGRPGPSSTADRSPGVRGAWTRFYRLKIVDLDGSYTYSPVANVSLGGSKGIFIYPNPARNTAVIHYTLPSDTRQAVAELYNTMGQRMNVGGDANMGGTGSKVINIAHLPPGIYHVVIRSGGVIVGREKLVVEK